MEHLRINILVIIALLATVGLRTKPKVHILAIGGTITGVSISSTSPAYSAGQLSVETLVATVPQIKNIANVSGEQICGIGSQDTNDQVWLKLAKRINQLLSQEGYDGMLITHGADTMERTAYFLGLIVHNNKPVILIGAIRPATAISADGPANLYNTVTATATPESRDKGAMVCMSDQLFDVKSIIKTYTTDCGAFKGGIYGQIGNVFNGKAYYLQTPTYKRETESVFNMDNLDKLPQVGIIYGYSGCSGLPTKTFVDAGYDGIVLAGADDGNFYRDVFGVTIKAQNSSIQIVRSSRVPTGPTNLNIEAGDSRYHFVASLDLDPQKAHVLLILALTKIHDQQQVQRYYQEYQFLSLTAGTNIMNMKKIMMICTMVSLTLGASAQGNDTDMGGEDSNYKSLAGRLFRLKKKSDAFNVYFNYASSLQEAYDGNDWGSPFKNKQARLEIEGSLGKLSYRFRHRLNKTNSAQGEDNFIKATDILPVGYQVTDKLGITGGKTYQSWGGFELNENPMYIYQYSDIIDNMDNFMADVDFALKPMGSQEFSLNITNAYNNKLAQGYGVDLKVMKENEETETVEAAKRPLTYILLQNDNFLGDKLQTRWSVGTQTQTKDQNSQVVMLGQKSSLSTFQWYFDYMSTFDDVDHLGIATSDLSAFRRKGNVRCGKVNYNSFITKVNWQFAPQWNLMLGNMYGTASVSKIEELKSYHKSFGYFVSLEYYPVKSQNCHVFLSYIGRNYKLTNKSKLANYNTSRIELDFIYRVKVF